MRFYGRWNLAWKRQAGSFVYPQRTELLDRFLGGGDDQIRQFRGLPNRLGIVSTSALIPDLDWSGNAPKQWTDGFKIKLPD